MPLSQLVLRCVAAPFKATGIHRTAGHQVVRHVGHLGRLPIHRIAAHIRPAFGLVCRYVPIVIGIGASALVPPVAISPPLVPPVSSPLTPPAGDYGWPSGIPGMFSGSGGLGNLGPQAAVEQASLPNPVNAPFQFTIDSPPTFEDLPLVRAPDPDDTHPTFPITNTPGRVPSMPTAPPVQGVPEPSDIAIMLPGLLALLLRRQLMVRRRCR
jgi:hypothetical protein